MKQRKVYKLFLRDGPDCHICRLPVRLLTLAVGPGSATADHVVPRSKGGRAAMTNMKLAHKFCNSLRGDRELTAELRSEIREKFQRKMGNLKGGIIQ